MAFDFQDKVKIQSGLGFTREQIDLAEYNLIKVSKSIKEKKYQELKSLLSLKQKKELLQLVITLALENINLAEIIVFDTNREYALSKERIAEEKKEKEISNGIFELITNKEKE